MAKRTLAPGFRVQLHTIEEVGPPCFSARDALQQVGEHWDNRGYSPVVRGHYEFELDGHRFLVHVQPTGESRNFDDSYEPSGSQAHNAQDEWDEEQNQ
jgi:hypothetical protein